MADGRFSWVVAAALDDAFLIYSALGLDGGSTGSMGTIASGSTEVDNFGLECMDTDDCGDCLYGDLCNYDVFGDVVGTSGADGMDSFNHGRFVWDYLNQPLVDLCTDDLTMLFTGLATDAGGCTPGAGAGELYLLEYTPPVTCPGWGEWNPYAGARFSSSRTAMIRR
jgi:hypothetical protein